MALYGDKIGTLNVTRKLIFPDVVEIGGIEVETHRLIRPQPKFHVMVWGNSLAENSYDPAYTEGFATRIQRADQRGFMHYLRHQVKYPWFETYTAGNGGTTTVDALARINDVLRSPDRPDAIWTVLGGNEIQNGIDVATISIPTLKNIVTQIADNGILPIVSIDWGPTFSDSNLRGQLDKFHWTMWIWCMQRGYPFLDIRTPMVQSETEINQSATYSQVGTVVTWTATGHGIVVDQWVNITGATDSALDDESLVLTADANSFTTSAASATRSGSATIKASRMLVGKTSDNLHTEVAGATDIADYLSANCETWPISGSTPLAVENFDYENMVGAGRTAAATSISCGMPAGTGGTTTGTPTPSGSIAAGWALRSLTGSNGATSVVGSKGVLDAPLEHVPTQIVVATSGASVGGNYHFYCQSTIPGDWSAGAKSLNDWALPSGGNKRLWLVCIQAGTPSAAPVCTESTTPPGTQITDGTVVWEVRRGWLNGDTVLVSGQARLKAATSAGVAVANNALTDLCATLGFGLSNSDTGVSVNDIVDIIHGTNQDTGGFTSYGRRRVGKTYTFMRQGVISGSPSSIYVGWKFACKGGNAANDITVEMSRAALINMTALGLA